MSQPDPSSLPPEGTPHVRLNSNTSNILTSENYSNPPSGLQRQNSTSGRSLVPPNPPPHRPLRDDKSYGNVPVDPPDTLLIPPSSRSRTHRFRDEESAPASPTDTPSRRTSLGSLDDHHRDPFRDSRSASRSPSDDDNVNTQTVSEKYNILPSAGLLLFPEDVEKDDYLHNPDIKDPEPRCNCFNRRGLVNVGGLIFVIGGVLVLFIAYPVITFTERFTGPTDPCKDNPDCLNIGKVPLLQNLRTGLIDPDTPKSAMSKTAPDGTSLKLVFSDEFNKDGRTFYQGDDPYWQAVDLWYGVTQDLEWYDPDAITTGDGVLQLRFDAFANHGLNYRSGMLQSWNKMCFTGGQLEASISLPGRGDTVGFWPGFWSMGNLGRPGYAATTDGMWPYSYHDQCDAGITANQSSHDGLSYLPGMRLPGCTCTGEDHPNPGKARSAPEIDALEASNGPIDKAGNVIGTVSQSCQLAPFDIWYQPNTDFIEVYDNSITQLNTYQGGPFQQALSGLSNLNNNWYDGKEYAQYGFYYTPGSKGAITWSVADEPVWKLDARSIGPNGNVGQRLIPAEPMSVIANLAMSPGFSQLNLTGIAKLLPATMRFDWIRIYQPEGSESVTCEPEGYETSQYILNHMDAYTNPNKTQWSQTNHPWPKNSLVNGCKAGS